jgi:ribosomal subunit interface protein
MQILVTTDNNIDGGERFSLYVETEVRTALHRYADMIARVEVHFSDENGAKSGGADKRCLIEAHSDGKSPLTASNHAATLQEAFDGAAKKMAKMLEATLGRLHHHIGDPSIRAERASE